VKHIVKNNGEGDIDPTYPCLGPTNLWKWQCLDGTKPTPYQHLTNMTYKWHPFTNYACRMCEWAFARQFVQAPIVVVLTCIEVYMQEDVIDYCATWYIWIWSWKHGTHVYKPMAYSRWFGFFHDNGNGGIQGEERVMTLVKSPPWMRVNFQWMMLEDLMNQKVQMFWWK
jgi:hypothetical protein